MRVGNGFPYYHTVQQNPFRMRADLFRHAQAGLIPQRDHDLDANQSQMFEGEACGELRGAPCNALSVTGRPYPVTKIAEVINRVNAA